jgi:hypothetical protein
MAHTLVPLKEFLEQRRLSRKRNGLADPQARQRLEQSRLLRTMRDICAAINGEAGTVLIDEHHYLPPEPVVSSFAFSKGQTEYVMRLELWGATPSLVFVTRKWRDASAKGLLRWVYRLAEMEPVSVNIRFTREFDEDEVSGEEIKRWFYYLLSGLDRSYFPLLSTPKDPPDRTIEE